MIYQKDDKWFFSDETEDEHGPFKSKEAAEKAFDQYGVYALGVPMKKGFEIDVLDHGYVRFIDSMGTDETVIEAARMSTGRGFEGWEKDANLLDFLYRNRHSTPFEMCELTLEVQAPIMVFREWMRHRTMSYNEFSARYSVMPNTHYLPDASRIQEQSKTNKQGSGRAINEKLATAFIEDLRDEQEHVYSDYAEAIEMGLAKEIARINTPVSRYSKMRVKTDLRNWLSFLNLRLRPNAQYEIRVFAQAVATIINALWPRTFELFEKYDLRGVSFSSEEMRALRAYFNDLGVEKVSELAERFGSFSSPKRFEEFKNKLVKGGLETL